MTTSRARPALDILTGLALSLVVGVASGEDAEPKDGLEVSVGFADTYAQVPFHFQGVKTDPETRKLIDWRDEARGVARVFPACGAELQFKLAAASFGKDREVRVSGKVTDYYGKEVRSVSVELQARDGVPESRLLRVSPPEEHEGPYYFRGEWSEVGGEGKGSFSLAAGQANRRCVVGDFELVRYPKSGGPLESSPQARHRGNMGLIARLIEHHPGPGRKPTDPQRRSLDVPLGLQLPERPVKVGIWFKPSAEVQVTLRLRDPGVEINQGERPDFWAVGPISVPAGEWRYVEIPMPGFGKPKAEFHPYGEANGIIDYPLTIERVEIEGPAGAEVFLDDLEVWTQGARQGSVQFRAAFDKPGQLLYRTDTLKLAVTNQRLWGNPLPIEVTARLEDTGGQTWPLLKTSLDAAPGKECVAPAPVKDLPVGGYRLLAEARQDGKLLSTVESRLIVYEPGGQRLGHRELHALLGDRDRLLVDLGFAGDIVLIPRRNGRHLR